MHIPFIELEVRYSFDRPRRSTGGRVSFDRNIFNVTVDVLPRFFPQLVVHLGIEISIVELELSTYVLSKKSNSKSTLHPVAHFFLCHLVRLQVYRGFGRLCDHGTTSEL